MATVKNTILSPVNVQKRQEINIKAGDTVRVHIKIEEKGKTRIQIFEGLVLARKHGDEAGGTFTVRRVSGGIGVEKIFPIYSPFIEKIEVIKRAKVRQANLYHIRRKAAKEVRRQMKNVKIVSESTEDDPVEEQKITEDTNTEKKENETVEQPEVKEQTLEQKEAETQPEVKEEK